MKKSSYYRKLYSVDRFAHKWYWQKSSSKKASKGKNIKKKKESKSFEKNNKKL